MHRTPRAVFSDAQRPGRAEKVQPKHERNKKRHKNDGGRKRKPAEGLFVLFAQHNKNF